MGRHSKLNFNTWFSATYIDATQRDSGGDPLSSYTNPQFPLPSGIRNSLIRFPVEQNFGPFSYLQTFEINGLTVTNVTQYEPTTAVAGIIELGEETLAATISNVVISNFDMIRGSSSLFVIKPYGTLQFSQSTFTDINKIAYNLDTSDFEYLPTSSGVFKIEQINEDGDYGAFDYLFSDVNMTGIYGKEGPSFYISMATGATSYHETSVTLNSIKISDSFSTTRGQITLMVTQVAFSMIDCTMQSNTGLDAEADLRIEGGLSVEINTTSILYPITLSDRSTTSGKSIAIIFVTTVTLVPQFNQLTLTCSEDPFDSGDFETKITTPGSSLIGPSTIYLGPGKIETNDCTFSLCSNSEYGGVLYATASSVITDNGSTFTQNAAQTGGAVSLVNAQGYFTGTIFSYNYAINGGAMSAEAISVIHTFVDVDANNNHALETAAVLSLTGTSEANIENSTFYENLSEDQASVFYFLGTANNVITNCEFYSNEAWGGNTMMFLFANTVLTNITLYDNIVYADSTGIFITFSEITIADSLFKTQNLPFGASSLEQASLSAFNLGCFVSISAGCTVNIRDSNFQNGYGVSGGHLYISGNSEVTINGCNFGSTFVTSDGGAIYASGFKTLQILDSTFADHTAKRDGADLYLSSGSTTISNCNFTALPNPSSILVSSGNFTASNLKMENSQTSNTVINEGYLGGAIYAENTESFSLTDSEFSNFNYAEQGGAIFLSFLSALKGSAIPSMPTFVVSSCTFTSNSAVKGGAIYVDNVDYAQISSCTFTSNTAVTDSNIGKDGEGGAIYYGSSGKSYFVLIFRFHITTCI